MVKSDFHKMDSIFQKIKKRRIYEFQSDNAYVWLWLMTACVWVGCIHCKYATRNTGVFFSWYMTGTSNMLVSTRVLVRLDWPWHTKIRLQLCKQITLTERKLRSILLHKNSKNSKSCSWQNSAVGYTGLFHPIHYSLYDFTCFT